jgi:hypothetical protein
LIAEAGWLVKDVHVEFSGSDVECDGLIVETTRYQMLQKQRQSEVEKNRPRL